MFPNNTISGVRKYFHEKLDHLYDEREVDYFFEWTCQDEFDLKKTDLLTAESRFSESELLRFRTIIKKLKEKIPIQYILGKAHVLDLEFEVGEGVLCPRPETEELIAIIIDEVKSGKLLDIGTGSGIIPICVKKYSSEVKVSGLDVSKQALEYAQLNARRLEVDVKWIEMDILNDLPKESYDVIVSNPPYVLEMDKEEMDENVLKHEPELALFVADDNPLKFYRRIAEISNQILNPSGKVYFEIHEKFGEDIYQMLTEYNFKDIEILKDLQGKDRMVRAIKKP